MITLSSRRLVLYPLSVEDKDFFVSLFTNKDVMKYIGTAHDLESAENKLLEFLSDCKDKKRYLWVVKKKNTEVPIGIMGLSSDCQRWNLGAMLKKDMIGFGFGPEAMYSVITAGFDILKIDTIYGVIMNEHKVSQKAAKEVGFRYHSSLEDGTSLWAVYANRVVECEE